MKRRLRCNFVAFVLALLSIASIAQAAPTETLYLSGTDKDHTVPWQFRVADGRKSGVWTTIGVPSNWETQGFGTYTKGSTAAPRENGFYKYAFTPPSRWRRQNITLVFEGVMTDTAVKINGASAGPIHQGGFYRFTYDITPLLQFGKSNLLEVAVNKDSANNGVNRAERQGDYWAFAGIFRPVYLEVRPAQAIARTAVSAKADGAFATDVYLQGVTNADTLRAQVQRLNGAAVGRAFTTRLKAGTDKQTLSAKIDNPLRWTAETPNLYQVEIKLLRGRREIHRVTQRFGFRTIEVRAGDGIYLNGTKIRLKGSNRHSFWPDSGRTTSAALSRSDVLLMKAMNMNAVRMSHYPPDQHFLDVCDELGLYVLDELAGWQKSYDTPIGEKLVRETVIRDVNHPSILFWDNGNEGGWNTDLDDDFALYDPQKRSVLHPWSLFSDIDTGHYKTYDATQKLLKDNNIVMPTEFLHALYDGGAGAGLDDYWNLMLDSPRGAGGFIWAFVDEGLVRGDQNGAIDVNGNRYPDGILGPYREKEGSFYTIKDIWSPIQVAARSYYEKQFPNAFDGQVSLLNQYDFTNANQCRFSWQLVNFPAPSSPQSGHTVIARGSADSPDIAPGAGGKLNLVLPTNWRNADAVLLNVIDPFGRGIQAWTWPIHQAIDFKNRIVRPAPGTVTASEDAQNITLTTGALEVKISKSSGQLVSAQRNGANVGLANGPTLAAGTAQLTNIAHKSEGAAQVVQANYEGNLDFVRWRLQPGGWLQLEYKYNLSGAHDFLGVNFDFPEKPVTGVKWLGDGPYRVWKNRLRGVSTDVWSKAYNDTATGADGWKYPEFKGYYAQTYWVQLQTQQGALTMVTPDENLFLRLFTPRNGPEPKNASMNFPKGDISFLDGIAPIGNKFHGANATGPQGAPNEAKGDYQHTLYFYFGAFNAAAP